MIANLAIGLQVNVKSFDTSSFGLAAEPYDEGYLKVSELHSLYYAQFGNPAGLPVVVVHGGPGGGCEASWSSCFDLSFYRVVMFDQRGASRSKPMGAMQENTPQKSVEDMEVLRKHLGIDKWLLFGGSWGSALSILYGETHPDRALGFVLRGIFLARQKDYEHLVYGMKATFPDAWEDMVQAIPVEERSDLISAFHDRIMDPDPKVHLPAAQAFSRYETICGTLLPITEMELSQGLSDHGVLSVSRAFFHYTANHFFFRENQLLEDIDRIAHLPAILVHGRYDAICLPQIAFELHKNWEGSKLWFISNAGHFASEPPIGRALREATEEMKSIISNF